MENSIHVSQAAALSAKMERDRKFEEEAKAQIAQIENLAFERGKAEGIKARPTSATGDASASGASRSAAPFAARVAAQDLDARSEQEWNSSAELRGEFPSLGSYQAYQTAAARGQVKIFTGGTVKHYERPAAAAK
ncbi:MAG: hypothetical protein ABSG54_08360 [Terriglobia bacterium]|jgi:hypothetical protein